MTEQQRMDQESRNAILTQIDKNFFVEAGAGSGKTTMLVNRLVAMVESGVDIRKICTITYTKAAAAEFYGRFRTMLQNRSREDYVPEQVGVGHLAAPTEQTRRYCLHALRNIDLCFMGTIDSFCKMILSEHPLEANIPSDMILLDDLAQTEILSDIFQNILVGVYDVEVPGLSQRAKEFKKEQWHVSEAFAAGMMFLLKNRGVTFQYPADDIDTTDLDLLKLKSVVDCLQKNREVLQHVRTDGDRAAWDMLALRGPSLLDGGITECLKGIKSLRGVKLIKNGTDLTAYPQLIEWYELKNRAQSYQWTEKLDTLENKLKNKKYRLCLKFLLSCCGIVETEMKLNGYITFFDTLYYLRNMLKESAENGGELIRYIRKRHSFFLVDEFQDTNPIQGEILFYLSSDTPAAKWTDCVPASGSLFMVGDPKQSIYRFNGADVASYLRIESLFGTSNWGQVRHLPNNFRSTGTLKKYFNAIFSQCMSEENDEQRRFEEIPIREEDGQENTGCSNVWIYELMNEGTHQDIVLRLIQTLVGNKDYAFVHKRGEEPKPITYGDIMVITKGKGVLSSYVRTLNAANIPTWVEGGVPYQSNRALLLAANLFSALVDFENTAALYGVLTSGLYAFEDEELMQFRSENGRLRLSYAVAESQEICNPVERALYDLSVFSRSIRNLSPVAALNVILDTYRIFEAEEPKDLELVYDVIEQLKQAVADGTVVSLKTAAAFVQNLIWDGGRERCLRFSQNENCVHLANLHKVKGLEAPVVILAPAGKTNGSPFERIERNADGTATGYWFGCKNPQIFNNTYFETTGFSEQSESEKMSAEYERIRLKYVAATRARNMLLIYEKQSAKGESRSYWSDLIPQDPKHFPIESKDLLEDAKTNVTVSELYNRHEGLQHDEAEVGSYTINNPSRSKVSSRLSESEITGNIEMDLDVCEEVHKYPTIWGTMVHRIMELLVSTNNTIQTDALVSLVWNELSVVEMDDEKDVFIKALTRVCDTIRSGGYEQLNDCPKDILLELLSAEECLCEVPFCCQIGDEVWNGIMDVIYKKDGIWHIVDYKTDKNGENLDAVHRGQLEAYKQAFYATTGERAADAKIYHIAE